MKMYVVDAWNDWGIVVREERIKASSFHTAANRAVRLAERNARKRGSKSLTLKMVFAGNISRDPAAHLGLPDDGSGPEETL